MAETQLFVFAYIRSRSLQNVYLRIFKDRLSSWLLVHTLNDFWVIFGKNINNFSISGDSKQKIPPTKSVFLTIPGGVCSTLWCIPPKTTIFFLFWVTFLKWNYCGKSFKKALKSSYIKKTKSLQAGLGVRHLVHQHPQFVVGLFSPSFALINNNPPPQTFAGGGLPRSLPTTPPAQRHTFCRVCGQKFLMRQVRLLSLHYHQQHLRYKTKGFFVVSNNE